MDLGELNCLYISLFIGLLLIFSIAFKFCHQSLPKLGRKHFFFYGSINEEICLSLGLGFIQNFSWVINNSRVDFLV